MACVLNEWVTELNLKMQTVLIVGLRGPDQAYCPNLKKIHRWLRSLCLRNADPDHTFMKHQDDLPSIAEIEHEFEHQSVHYALHLTYALEVISYKHPEAGIRGKAAHLYRNITSDLLHFNFESETEMDHRLADAGHKQI